MNIYSDAFWDAQAAKLTDTSQILKLPWEEKIDSQNEILAKFDTSSLTEGNYYLPNGDYILTSNNTQKVYVIFPFSPKGSVDIKKWDFSKGYFWKELPLLHEEFLDRAHWVYGESGQDLNWHSYYAHSIQNAKLLGIHGTGETQFSSEAEMQFWLMQDEDYLTNDLGHIILPLQATGKGIVRISMQQYRVRTQDTRAFDSIRGKTLGANTYQKSAIASVIESLLFSELDPTPKEVHSGWGTNAWLGGHTFFHKVRTGGVYAEHLPKK